jgi:hypothetical protein
MTCGFGSGGVFRFQRRQNYDEGKKTAPEMSPAR